MIQVKVVGKWAFSRGIKHQMHYVVEQHKSGDPHIHFLIGSLERAHKKITNDIEMWTFIAQKWRHLRGYDKARNERNHWRKKGDEVDLNNSRGLDEYSHLGTEIMRNDKVSRKLVGEFSYKWFQILESHEEVDTRVKYFLKKL